MWPHLRVQQARGQVERQRQLFGGVLDMNAIASLF